MAKKKPEKKHETNGKPADAPENPEAEAPEEIDTVRGELNRLKDRWAKVADIEQQVSAAALEMDARKRDLKEAKDAYETYVARLRNAIKQADNPQQELPFPSDEDWRDITLEDLDITGKLAENLTEAGLTTLGEIAAYTEAGKLLTDIKGVGEKAAEKIEAATATWWENNPGVKEPGEEEDEPVGATATE